MTKPTDIAKVEEKEMEYIPYGAQDKIKLRVSIVKNLIAVKTKTGKTCSDNEAIKFMMMCQARHLNPFEGDAFLIGYDGKDGPTFSLITAHQAFLKRAELNPEFDGMKSGIIIDRNGEVIDVEGDFFMSGDKILGGWATVFFKNRKQAMHKRIRLERFKKPFGIWQEDAAGMICKCAEADALRSSFPTMLGGLYLKEEVSPASEAKVSAPIFTSPGNPKLVEASPVAVSKDTTAPLIQLRKLCLDAELDEGLLLEKVIEVGLVENQSVKKLDDIPEDEAGVIVDNFQDIISRIEKLGEETP